MFFVFFFPLLEFLSVIEQQYVAAITNKLSYISSILLFSFTLHASLEPPDCKQPVKFKLKSSFPGPHLSIIILLPLVGEHRPNDVSRVFDDHLSSINGFLAEQTSAMNGRPADGYNF